MRNVARGGQRDASRLAPVLLSVVAAGCPATSGDVLFLPDRTDAGAEVDAAVSDAAVDAGPPDDADAGVVPALSLSSDPPPFARVGRPWTWRSRVTGGGPNLTVDVTTAPDLPATATVSGAAVEVTVTPWAIGPLAVEVVVSRLSATATAGTTVEVRPPTIAGAVTASVAMVGQALSTTVARVTGGRPPYQWSVDALSLPNGVTARPDGDRLAFEGTPTATGAYALVVDVRDADGDGDGTDVALLVDPALRMRTAPVSTTLGAVTEVTAEATGGRPPYRWSLTGALPPGMTPTSTVGPTGVWSGRAGTTGVFPIQLRLEDSLGRTVHEPVDLVVNDSGVRLAIQGPTTGTVAACRPFSAELTTVGGGRVGTQWQVQLSDGLVAEARGSDLRVAGLFPSAQVAFADISVRDANGETASTRLSVEVGALDTAHLGDEGRWFVRTATAPGAPLRAGDRCRWPPTDILTAFDDSNALTRLAAGRFGLVTDSGSSTDRQRSISILQIDDTGLRQTLVHTSSATLFAGLQRDVLFAGGQFAVYEVYELFFVEAINGFFPRRRVVKLPLEPGSVPVPVDPQDDWQEDQTLEEVSEDASFAILAYDGGQFVFDLRDNSMGRSMCDDGRHSFTEFVRGARRPTIAQSCVLGTGLGAYDGQEWTALRSSAGRFDLLGGPWRDAGPWALTRSGELFNVDDPNRRYRAAGDVWSNMTIPPGSDWAAGWFEEPREDPLGARNPPRLYFSPLPPPATTPLVLDSGFQLSFRLIDGRYIAWWLPGQGVRLQTVPLGPAPMAIPGDALAMRAVGNDRLLVWSPQGARLYSLANRNPTLIWSDARLDSFGSEPIRTDGLGVWLRDGSHRPAFLDLLSGFEPRVVTATTADAWPRFRVVPANAP